MSIWKDIDAETSFCHVPGGFLIRTIEYQESGNGIGVAVACVFIPCADFKEARNWYAESIPGSPDED